MLNGSVLSAFVLGCLVSLPVFAANRPPVPADPWHLAPPSVVIAPVRLTLKDIYPWPLPDPIVVNGALDDNDQAFDPVLVEGDRPGTDADSVAAASTPAPAPVPPKSRPARGPRLVGGIPVPVARPLGASPGGLGQLMAATDAAIYEQAFNLASRGRYDQARAIAARGNQPVATRLIDWIWLIDGADGATFDDIANFIDDNPGWPGQTTLRRRAEHALDKPVADHRVLAFFGGRAPLTARGMMRLGEALLAVGRTEEAEQWLRRAWVEGDFPRRLESTFLVRHGHRLAALDHNARLDRLLWDRRLSAVRRMMRHVDVQHRRLAEARLALIRRSGNVDRRVARVPASLGDDPGLVYERIRWRRRAGMDQGAQELLLNPPPGDLVRPERWWIERRIQARNLLADGRYRDAYKLAQDHRMVSGSSFAEAEFLAGWIALRFLKSPDLALRHFERLYGNVRYPISLARGAYWSGRAEDARGAAAQATAWYQAAARRPLTYYGQLAALRLQSGDRLALPPTPGEVDEAMRQAFEKRELVRAVRLLAATDHARRLRSFILHLNQSATSAEERYLTASLAADVGRADLAIAATKRAALDDVWLIELSYPEVPALYWADGRIEFALAHALARQESEMDPMARSHAGARGLMQLMPATAKRVARRLGLPYHRMRLINDPIYNVQLGSHYLAGLLERFNGSYPLAIAAYNAGPHRVDSWLRQWGDPRRGDLDMIDWIELIPFTETRNYVQRVMENLQIYRARLGDDGPRLRLASDLASGTDGAAAGCSADMTPSTLASAAPASTGLAC